METEIELIRAAPRHYVGIRRTVPVTELQPFFAAVLPQMAKWIAARGITPTSAPMAVWREMNMETGIADTHAGFFVDTAVEGDGEISAGTTAEGEVLKLVHVGGYDTMGKSWMKVYARAKELGCRPGAGWEIYVDDPTTVAADEMKTEIYLPLS